LLTHHRTGPLTPSVTGKVVWLVRELPSLKPCWEKTKKNPDQREPVGVFLLHR
jgi:hypothetical protein